MAWMMELASLIFLTDVVLLFSKSIHFNATIYIYIFGLSVCCILYCFRLCCLEIIDPAIKLADVQQCIAPCNLHPVTRETCRKLFHAIDARFLQRYPSITDRSLMLDCCAFLYPPLSKLPYVNFILSSDVLSMMLAHLNAKQQGNAPCTTAILAAVPVESEVFKRSCWGMPSGRHITLAFVWSSS